MDQRETAKAAQAFQDYVALGPGRSLRLHADRVVAVEAKRLRIAA